MDFQSDLGTSPNFHLKSVKKVTDLKAWKRLLQLFS